jgi:enterochelin esterase family protein
MVEPALRKDREEAAPSFPAWKQRIEQARKQLADETDRFLEVLKTVGNPLVEGSTVYFVYYDLQARQVGVTGEFNQWGTGNQVLPMTPLGDTGFFFRALEVPAPARLEYKLVVNGNWILDPFCPNSVDNGLGSRNSYFVVGDLTEPPELKESRGVPRGKVEELQLPGQTPGTWRAIHVYVPPGYAESRTQRFPTLYVHDGGEYLQRARLATVLDNLIFAADIPPLIAVMADPVDRMREYRCYEPYLGFVESRLLPEIDRRYRTQTQRQGRAVMGASMGGLAAFYVALSLPSLFSRVGGQSSAFLLEEAKSLALAERADSKFRFYFDVGRFEPNFIPSHKRLLSVLRGKGNACYYQELSGGHNWTNWRAHLKDLLVFLWGRPTGTPAA